MSTVELTDRQPSDGLTWIQTYKDADVDFGSLPSDVPMGAFSVLAGVDGRYGSHLRTMPGYTLWLDLGSATELKSKILDPLNEGTYNRPNWQRGILDFQPFILSKVGSLGYVYGMVVSALPYYSPEIPTSITNYLVWRDSSPLIHTPDDPWHANVATHDGFSFTRIRSAARLSGATAEFPVQLTPNLPTVVAVGRILYVWGSGTDISLVPALLGIASWYVGPETAWNTGWRHDYAGIPPQEHLYLNMSGSEITGGLLVIGGYRFAGRLIDTLRHRASNMAWDQPTITDSVLVRQPSPNNSAHEEFAANDGYVHLQLINYLTSGVIVSSSFHNLDLWDQHQAFATPSATDTAGGEVIGGGAYRFVDQMPTRVEFTSFSGAEPTLAAEYDLGVEGDRIDGSGAAFAADGIQKMPVTNTSIATGFPYNFNLDDYLNWYEEALVYNATLYGSLMVKAVNLRSRRETQGDEAPQHDIYDQLRNRVTLIWSDARRFGPENVPFINYYDTKYPVPDLKGLATISYNQTTQDQARRDAVGTAKIGLAEASNSLYIYGDGPIYRMTQQGSSVGVSMLGQSLTILNRQSLCSVGYAVFLATESGFWIQDGASGSLTQLTILDRIIRDRWKSATLRKTIQLAYDTTLDVVCVLCAGAGEMLKIWLGARKITMESCNFSYARSVEVPTKAGQSSKRVLFSTFGGKIFYMNHLEGSDYRQYTMHGLTTIAPLPLVVKVTSRSNANFGGYYGSRLSCAQLDGALWRPNNRYLTEITFVVLSGPLTHKVYQTTTYVDADNIGALYVLGEVPPEIVGETIAISPIPLISVGGPLVGRTQQRYLERKHVDHVLPVAVRATGDTSWQANAPMLYAGVCSEAAILAAESISEPGQLESGQLTSIWKRGGGPMPQWVDLAHESVVLSGCPDEGFYDHEAFDRNMAALGVVDGSVDPPSGTSALVPLPILVSWQAGFVLDLVESYWLGWSSQSKIASASPNL